MLLFCALFRKNIVPQSSRIHALTHTCVPQIANVRKTVVLSKNSARLVDIVCIHVKILQENMRKGLDIDFGNELTPYDQWLAGWLAG